MFQQGFIAEIVKHSQASPPVLPDQNKKNQNPIVTIAKKVPVGMWDDIAQAVPKMMSKI